MPTPDDLSADLIDQFLPRWDVRERHTLKIDASRSAIWAALESLDMSESRPIRWLFKLRGLPAAAMTLDGIERLRFIRLAERRERELLIGIVGRFWTPSGDLQRLAPAEFHGFDRPGYAKAAWNFLLGEETDSGIALATETRISTRSRLFRVYWAVVGPFSGWTRREMLRLVKAKAERAETNQ